MNIFTKFHKDWTTIVNFLLIAKFWASLLLFAPPYTYLSVSIPSIRSHLTFLLVLLTVHSGPVSMSLPNERSNGIESFANIVFVTCASFQAGYEGFEGNVRRNWIFRQLFAELAGKMLIWAILAPRNADKLALGGSPFHPLPLLPMLSLQKKVIADGCFYLYLFRRKDGKRMNRLYFIFFEKEKNLIWINLENYCEIVFWQSF